MTRRRDVTGSATGWLGGWRKAVRSIQVQMALLVLALLLINGLAVAFLTLVDYRTQNRLTQQQLTQTATALSLAVDGRIRGSIGEMKALALSPQFQAKDLESFARLARAEAKGLDQSIVLVDDRGRFLVNTSTPPDAPVPATSSALFQAYRREGAGKSIYVSNLIFAPDAGGLIVGAFMPSPTATQPIWHLGIRLVPSALQRIFADEGLPPDWYGSLLDRQGRVIARSVHAARYVGHLASAEVRRDMAHGANGVFHAPALEGYPTLGAYKRSGLTGWTMVVAMPEATARAALVRSLVLNVALVFGLMLLGVALVWLLGGRLVGAIRNLARSAEALGRGASLEPPIAGLGEIDAVGSAMHEASVMLRRREDELRERQARIRRLVESNIIGVFFWAADGRITQANDAALALLGYDREELLSAGIRWTDLTPPEWRVADQQALAQLRASGSCHAFEKEFIRKDGGRVPVLLGAATFSGTSEEGVAFVLDLTEQKEAEKHLKLMVDELNHRVKNTLATVMAISAQSLRTATSLDGFRQAFQGRLQGLSSIHNLLNQTFWTGVGLRDVVEQALAPYVEKGDARVSIEGGELRLGPIAAVTLGMALHELAVNAAKYGALSAPSGRVRVAWRPGEPGRVRLDWEESGGPPVQPPTRHGFGSALIEKVLAAELRGETRLEFPPQGVRCTMDMALERVSAH